MAMCLFQVNLLCNFRNFVKRRINNTIIPFALGAYLQFHIQCVLMEKRLMNVKSCDPRTILWVLSCIHTTNFYQWNIYLPRENYLNLPVVKFILGFNFIRWKGHTNLCHRCLGKIIKRQNVLARKSHRKHAWNSRISKFFLSVHFTLHFILFDEHSDLNIFFFQSLERVQWGRRLISLAKRYRRLLVGMKAGSRAKLNILIGTRSQRLRIKKENRIIFPKPKYTHMF